VVRKNRIADRVTHSLQPISIDSKPDQKSERSELNRPNIFSSEQIDYYLLYRSILNLTIFESIIPSLIMFLGSEMLSDGSLSGS